MARWFFKIVRSLMDPVERNRAQKWNDRLSILYAILAWNAAGFVMYQCYHGRADWPKALGLKTEQEEATPPAVYYSEILGIQNMKVKRISGFQVVDEYEIKDGIRVKKTEEESSST